MYVVVDLLDSASIDIVSSPNLPETDVIEKEGATVIDEIELRNVVEKVVSKPLASKATILMTREFENVS